MKTSILKNISRILSILCLVVLLFACKDEEKEKIDPIPDPDPIPDVKSKKLQLLNFRFLADSNALLDKDCLGAYNSDSTEIKLLIPHRSDAIALKANYKLSDKAKADTNLFISNNYRKPVKITVQAEDSTQKKTYTIIVERSKAIQLKNGKIFIDTVHFTHNGKAFINRPDSILRRFDSQNEYHFIQKHDKNFYKFKLNIEKPDAPEFSIMESFQELRFDDANYSRMDLRKLPLPFTAHAYETGDESNLYLGNVNELVNSKGHFDNISQQGKDKFKEVALKTVGSVVRIQGGGTGWFIDKDLILTNVHVVKNVGDIAVNGDYTSNPSMSVELWDGRKTSGRTWFASPYHDVALVKLDQEFTDVNLLSLTNRNATRGELILNIGGPNIARTYGKHLSILGITDKAYDFTPDISIHIACIAGQSGSPIFNQRGEIMGMMKLAGNTVSIKEGINYHEYPPADEVIFAKPQVNMYPYVGPKSATVISAEAMLRLCNYWLKSVDRELPSQNNDLQTSYNWTESKEEFYAPYDIGFPTDELSAINGNLPNMLKSIVTIKKKLTSAYSEISAETAIVYNQDYLIGYNFFPYQKGDVMKVLSYDRQVREAEVVAIADPFQTGSKLYLYKLKERFDATSTRSCLDHSEVLSTKDQPLLALGRSYSFPYPGCFQTNAVMYKNQQIQYLNSLCMYLPLFTKAGNFVGFSRLANSSVDSFNKDSRLYLRTTIPVAAPSLPVSIHNVMEVFAAFDEL